MFYWCDSNKTKLILHDYRGDNLEDLMCAMTPRPRTGTENHTWAPLPLAGRTTDITYPPALAYPDAPIGLVPVPPDPFPQVNAMSSNNAAMLTMGGDLIFDGPAELGYQFPTPTTYLEPLEGSAQGGYVGRIAISEYGLFDSCDGATLQLKWYPQMKTVATNVLTIAGVTLELYYFDACISVTNITGYIQFVGRPLIQLELKLPEDLTVPDWEDDVRYGVNQIVNYSGTKYRSLDWTCGEIPPDTPSKWASYSLPSTPQAEHDPSPISFYGHMVVTYTAHDGAICYAVSSHFAILDSTQAWEADEDYDWYITCVEKTIELKQRNDREVWATYGAGAFRMKMWLSELPLNGCGYGYGTFAVKWSGDEDSGFTPANARAIILAPG